MTKTTPLEMEALRGICASDYQDGQDPINNLVWTWSANPWEGTPDARRFSGVMSSLVKKGLAGTENGDKRKDDCVWITQAGFDALSADEPVSDGSSEDDFDSREYVPTPKGLAVARQVVAEFEVCPEGKRRHETCDCILHQLAELKLL